MTVRFKKFWNGRFPSVVEAFSEDLERQLVTANIAQDIKYFGPTNDYYRNETVTAEQTAYAAKVLADAEAHKASLG